MPFKDGNILDENFTKYVKSKKIFVILLLEVTIQQG